MEHMNYSNRYEKLRLDELGIPSDEEAEELEYELDLRFEDFTPTDRTTWLRQSDYLEHFSRTGTLSSAAKKAGVTILKAQRWQYDDILGFTRRDEIASLIFNDRLKEIALLRASDPKAPAMLLIELLRAYIPEEFSRNGHKCDSSKSDELLRRYSEDAGRNQEAGHPGLSKLAEDADDSYPEDDWPTEPNAYPEDDLPTEPDVYPDDNYHTDMNDYPAEPVSPDDLDPSGSHLSPAGEPLNSHLSPAGGETQRGGSSPTAPSSHEPSHATRHSRANGNPQDPSATSAPSAVSPSPSPVLGEGWGEGDPPSPQTPFSTSTQNPAPRTSIPNRAQRRAQLRQQRKAEKKNTFPVKRF